MHHAKLGKETGGAVAAPDNEINLADNFIIAQNISPHGRATGWFGVNISPHGR